MPMLLASLLSREEIGIFYPILTLTVATDDNNDMIFGEYGWY